MNEKEWAENLADIIEEIIPRSCFVETSKRLVYANEVCRYNDGREVEVGKYNEMKYETDVMICEDLGDSSWVPRVVIETKINFVSTHDAITYSQKAASHKQVHPYLRYGLILGASEYDSLPGRLFRHGVYFDFMAMWKEFDPSKGDLKTLKKIIRKEIKASQGLEDMIFNARKQDRNHYVAIHRSLELHEVE